MTTMFIDNSTVPALRATQPLRDLNRINAAFSAATGLGITAASSWLARQTGLPRPALVVVGVGLVGWSVLLVVLAIQPARRLTAASTLVAAGDAAWVFGSVVLIALGDLTFLGASFVIGAATVVGVFATRGMVLGRRARRLAVDGRIEILTRRVHVDAPPSAAWQMVLDADLYAQLAPNLTRIDVSPDECSRTCTDTAGNRWSEAMHLDHDRHIQQIDVDLAGHPMALDQLAATISVDDDPQGSRVDVLFVYITRRTPKGLLTSLALPVVGRRLLRPIANGWVDRAAAITVVGEPCRRPSDAGTG